jgi:hypothetical protein
VTSHDSPLSAEEADVLAWAGAAERPVFVVLNKQDVADAPARAETLAYVRGEATRLGAGSQLRLFPLSARDALVAKLTANAAVLAASGLPALESALIDFLVHDQRRAFLLGMCERIAALLFDPRINPGGGSMAERLAGLRARVTGATVAAPSVMMPAEPPLPALLPGCEVCAAVAHAVFGFFASTQSELYSSPHAQADLAARGGFCRGHAQQFEAIAARREAATALAPVLLRQAGELRRIAAAAPTPMQVVELVGGLLPDGRRCTACAAAHQAETAVINRLAALVRRDGATAVHASSAICLPHMRRLAGVLPGSAEVSLLLRRQAALMERMAEDTSRFALKQDAGRRGSMSKEEDEATWRAARVLLEAPQAQYDAASPGGAPSRAFFATTSA